VKYLKRAVDGGMVSGQPLLSAFLERDTQTALPAEKGLIETMLESAHYLITHSHNRQNIIDAEEHFKTASDLGSVQAQMKYGVALLSGTLGRFDFDEAHNQFSKAANSSSNRFAVFLRDVLSKYRDDLVTPQEFQSIFSVMRTEGDLSVPMIKMMNPHLFRIEEEPRRAFKKWQSMIELSIPYLINMSHIESTDGVGALLSLPTDLLSCNSIKDIIPLIFKMYSLDSKLYRNVNHFMRKFPISLINKFMKELHGFLSYIYLLQSSIAYRSRFFPLVSDVTVYRGISRCSPTLASLYESMIGELVVWPAFTSTSRNREFVIHSFLRGEQSILFDINLSPGDVVADITDDSVFPGEEEFLISASSAFIVVSVDKIIVEKLEQGATIHLEIPHVTLKYSLGWHDFEIDTPPPHFIIE
jgi:hypothetical protein